MSVGDNKIKIEAYDMNEGKTWSHTIQYKSYD